MHTQIPWDYRDSFGFALNQVTPTLGIKYNPTTGKYGSWGFCFKCGTHIACGMPNAVSKLATLNAHVCAQKQERERKGDGTVATRPKRTMTASATLEEFAKRIGADIELDDDLRFDVEKTIRLNKGRFGADSLWGDLKKSAKVGKACRDKEDEMRDDHADDEDMPPFSPLAVVEYFIEGEAKAVKNAQMSNRKVQDLRRDIDKLEIAMEEVKLRSAEKDVRIEKLLETIKFMTPSEKGDVGDVISHE